MGAPRPIRLAVAGLLALLAAGAPSPALAAEAPASGLPELLRRRPEPAPLEALRSWARGEYAYVRSYRLLDRAYARLARGDLTAAAEDLEAVLELQPEHPHLALYLADLHLRLEHPDRAATLLRDHLRRQPDDGQAHATLGYLLLDQGQSGTAAEHLARAAALLVNRRAQRAGVLANLAELDYAAGRYREALARYLELRSQLGDDLLLTIRTGLALDHLERWEEAVELYRRALAAAPADAPLRGDLQLALARALRRTERPHEALQTLDALLRAGESDPARVLQFELLCEVGSCAAALATYAQLGQAARDPDLALAAAYCARQLAQHGRAADLFRQVLETSAPAPGAAARLRLDLAAALRAEDLLDAAVEALQPALAGPAPTDPGLATAVRERLVELEVERGRCATARDQFRALPRAAQDPTLHLSVAWCEKRRGQAAAAAAVFEEVLAAGRLAPAEAARLRLELGLWWLAQERADRAVALLEPLLERPDLEPSVGARAALALVRAHLATGRRARAAAVLDTLAPQAADEFTAFRVYELYREMGLGASGEAHLERLAAAQDLRPALRQRAALTLAFERRGRGRDAAAADILERLLGGALGPFVQPGPRALAARTLAEIRAAQERWEAARESARQAWELAPEAGLGLFLADLERRTGRVAAAEARLRELTEGPAAAVGLRRRAAMELGYLLQAQGRPQEAETVWHGLVARQPAAAEAWAALAELAKGRGRAADYRRYATRLAELAPERVSGREMAATLAELGDPERALVLYRSLLTEEPAGRGRAELLRRMGETALQLGDRAGALDYLERYLAQARDADSEVLRQVALLHIHDGDCAAALGPLDTLIAREGRTADRLHAARCEEGLWEFPRAAQRYREVLDQAYDPAVALELAWVEERRGRRHAAQTALEELLARPAVPPDTRFQALILLSSLHGEDGRRDRQRALARRAVAVLPADASPETRLYALVMGGADHPELAAYENELRSLPDAAVRQARALRLSTLYELAGDAPKALEFAHLAVAARPTALARYRRGVLLYQTGAAQAALPDFAAALGTVPDADLYLAYVYAGRDQVGLATDVLENALARGSDAGLRRRLQRQLAEYYLADGQPERALALLEEIPPGGPAGVVLRARSLARLGQPAAALAALDGADAAAEPAVLRLRGELLRDLGRPAQAAAAYRDYQRHVPEDTEALCALGSLELQLGNPAAARRAFESAAADTPLAPAFVPAYAQSLAADGRPDAARGVLERYLDRYPRDLAVLEAAAYLSLDQGRTEAAAGYLQRSLAVDRDRHALAAGSAAAPADSSYHRKRALQDLTQHFRFTAYTVRGDLGGSGPSQGYRGVIPGQLGLQGAWRPPRIGFRNYRIFEITARLLGSFEADSWSYDTASTQLALGARYKPFSDLGLAVSLERLVRIGSAAEHNWLARLMGGHAWGRGLPFAPGWGHAGSLYGELGATFPAASRLAAYGELREGLRWSLGRAVALFPHAVLDGRWEEGNQAPGTYLEAGVGLELLAGWGESALRPHRWAASLVAQYKWGRFATSPAGQAEPDYRGPVLGVLLTY